MWCYPPTPGSWGRAGPGLGEGRDRVSPSLTAEKKPFIFLSAAAPHSPHFSVGFLWFFFFPFSRRFFLLRQAAACPFQLRTASVFSSSLELPFRSHLSLKPTRIGAGPASSWNHQQIRTKARGNEYQPNNRKRKRTHGWIKRISTPGGIEVILRRMLKGRKSLSH